MQQAIHMMSNSAHFKLLEWYMFIYVYADYLI